MFSKNNLKAIYRLNILFLLVITVSSITFSGCKVMPNEEASLAPPLIQEPKVAYDEVAVTKGSIEVTVKGIASFQPSKLTDEAFKYSVSYLSNIAVKVGDKVEAGQLLAEQETEDIKLDLTKKQLKLKMDQLTYDKINNSLNNATDEKNKFDINTQLQQQSINIELDKLDIEQAEKSLSRSQLTASISGIVVFVDSINPGDKVTANKAVVRIADPGNLQLQYSGDSIDKFNIGDKVNAKYNSQDYTGTVVANPSTAPADASSSSSAKKNVVINLDKMPEGVSVGDSADITLVLQKKDNVIVIPQSLVHQTNNQNYVEVLDKGLRMQRNVELGIKNTSEVEIVKGLNEGDKILKSN